MAAAKNKHTDGRKVIAENPKARYDYAIIETLEAGLVLTGTEVKSLRAGKVAIKESYVRMDGDEAFVIGMNIATYEQGNVFNHEPTRTRKLLLHRQQIRRLIGSVEREGLTLVPLDLHFKEGRVKVTLALVKGKKQHDKREDLKRKDDEREMARVARAR